MSQAEELRAILTTPFDNGGHLPGVPRERYVWALDVVEKRPKWAEPVLLELGFPPRGDGGA